jgi:ABC transport system ATP-binding/permease protein
MLLNISAIFMGTALTIRDLVGERAIFRREQAAGLSASAYLAAKITVYSIAAAVQTAVLTAIVVIGKGPPTRGAVILGNPTLELYVTLAATAAVAAIMGLALSAAATSQDQILPMLVMSVMLSIVFSGGLIPVTGRIVLDQFSWLLPARWGFAASASTVDLRAVAPLTPRNEVLWTHASKWWLLDMGMLAVLGLVMAGFVRWRVRLR